MELKFRAWGHHEWGSAPDDPESEKDAIPLDEPSMIYDIEIVNGLDERHSNPLKLVFMPYIGLKKHHKEVYLNDIVRFLYTDGYPPKELAVVRWDEDSARFYLESQSGYYFEVDDWDFEPIGNIYENRDLLEDL